MSKLDFAALLCSRLCHDLVSPVGAISNGLELLSGEQDGKMREAVLDLIEKSTAQTSNKLQFFRLAFGAAGGFSTHLDTREAEKSLKAFLAGSKINLNWHVAVPELSKGGVKLLLNLCLVASEALIRGGDLEVGFDTAGPDTLLLKIKASGNRIILADSVRQALLGQISEEDLEPRSAPAYLAYAVANEMHGKVVIESLDDNEVCLLSSIKTSA
jgi:histidine phosphotransferase ChpT